MVTNVSMVTASNYPRGGIFEEQEIIETSMDLDAEIVSIDLR